MKINAINQIDFVTNKQNKKLNVNNTFNFNNSSNEDVFIKASDNNETKEIPNNALSFKGKNTGKKVLTLLFGAIGTAGATTLAVLTGGVTAPMILTYGGVCALNGFIVGHTLDTASSKNDSKDK